MTEEWHLDALCAQTDPEMFFPNKAQVPHRAIKICDQCPVIRECLDYALKTRQDYGVWGGVTARERTRMLRGPVA